MLRGSNKAVASLNRKRAVAWMWESKTDLGVLRCKTSLKNNRKLMVQEKHSGQTKDDLSAQL